jgi:hypothetical protein
MFSNKHSIKHLYPFRAKCSVHIFETTQTLISKLSPRGIKCYVIGYTEASKILRLYDPQMRRVITCSDVVFSESKKCLESIKIELQTNLPLDLDDDAP